MAKDLGQNIVPPTVQSCMIIRRSIGGICGFATQSAKGAQYGIAVQCCLAAQILDGTQNG